MKRSRGLVIVLLVVVIVYAAWYMRHPLSAGNLVNRGIGKAEQGDLDGAVEDFTAAIQVEKWKPEAWYNRGKVHYDRHEWTAAIPDLTEAIDRGCTLKAEALVMRGHARQQLGDAGGADDIAAAERMKPNIGKPPTGR